VRIQSCPVLPLHAAHNYERYTYSITMAALIIKSASLLEYWSSKTSYHVVAILLFILVIFIINSRGVKVCTSVPGQS
jgi:amino acid permease